MEYIFAGTRFDTLLHCVFPLLSNHCLQIELDNHKDVLICKLHLTNRFYYEDINLRQTAIPKLESLYNAFFIPYFTYMFNKRRRCVNSIQGRPDNSVRRAQDLVSFNGISEKIVSRKYRPIHHRNKNESQRPME